jgi:hypothetical protein
MTTEPAVDRDVVVALPHLPLVLAALAEAGAPYATPDESPELGLARVPLVDDAAAADRIEEWAHRSGADRDTCHGHPRPTGADQALNRILWHLRAGFAASYAGWSPTLGKNRTLGQVEGVARPGVAGAGEVSHGGGNGPRAVAAPGAWASGRQAAPGEGVGVGVLDTALRPHPYLAGAWLGGPGDSSWAGAPGVESGDEVPDAEAGHATFVAGLVLRPAPGATIHARRVLGENGLADSWAAARAIVAAGRSGIHILNLSLVCYTADGEPPLVLAAAIDRLDPDIVVVAAAGNHGHLEDERRRRAAWPAALDDVVAVGATDTDGELSPLTPDGPWIDVLAPGDPVESTYLAGPVRVWDEGHRVVREFDGFAAWGGTSFAAALVSGAVAARTRPGRVSAREAAEELLRTAREDQVKRGLAASPVRLGWESLRPHPW